MSILSVASGATARAFLRNAQECGWYLPHEVDRRRGLVEQNPSVVCPPGLDSHNHGVRAVALAYRQGILTSYGKVNELAPLRMQSLLAERIQSTGRRAVVQPLRGDNHFSRCGDGDAVAVPCAHAVAGKFVSFGVF